MALDESQDSQAIFDAHLALFGVGSDQDDADKNREKQADACPGASAEVAAAARKIIDADATRLLAPGLSTSRPSGHEPAATKANTRAGSAGVEAVPTIDGPKAVTALSAARSMDASQQTPTQVNDDRDYSAFYEPSPGSPFAKPSQQPTGNDEAWALKGGETGAVVFNHHGDLARPSSQVSEDGGLSTTQSGWRVSDRTCQLPSHPSDTPRRPHTPYGGPSETPVLPKNPFSAKPALSAPLAGSQLFGKTQQVSSAVAGLSPTFSRPSPGVLLNPVSPGLVETPLLKSRANVSSPTEIRTSSPQRPHELPETLLVDQGDSGVPEESPREEPTLEPPTNQTWKPRASHQPLAQYEPMKQSQERKSGGHGPRQHAMSDDEYDDALQKAERRKRAERKRAQAAEEMDKVRCARSSRRASAEQASKQKKQKKEQKKEEEEKEKKEKNTRRENGEQMVESGETSAADDVEKQRAIAGRGLSRKSTPSSEPPSMQSTKATPGQKTEMAHSLNQGEGNTPVNGREADPVEEETIPATSPLPDPLFNGRSSVPGVPESELPELEGNAREGKQNGPIPMAKTSSPPLVRASRQGEGSRGSGQERRKPCANSWTPDRRSKKYKSKTEEQAVSIQASPPCTASAVDGTTRQDDAKVDAPGRPETYDEALPSRSRAHLTRARGNEPSTVQRSKPGSEKVSTSSSLTTPSQSPATWSKPISESQESLPSNKTPPSACVAWSAGSRNRRKRGREAEAQTSSLGSPPRARKRARRSVRPGPDWTDEPHPSPTAAALSRSAAMSRSARWFGQSAGSSHGGRRVFENMAFAVSCKSKTLEKQRRNLESQVVQGGGSILKDGFQELFEPAATLYGAANGDAALKLGRTSSGYGFTALIADGHSRKAKYMQALALGLPCLSQQWITACLGKGEVVDWEPYLLCAGSSAVLGNAMRSRVLAPYPAEEATLAQVLEHRRKLLEGQSILVVGDAMKGRKETTQQYMFLVQALGPATMVRAASAQQARTALAEREQVGRPFDWLYVDSRGGSIGAVLKPTASRPGAGRRKKTAGRTQVTGGERLRVRLLTDELVIQSLILGRMVEGDGDGGGGFKVAER